MITANELVYVIALGLVIGIIAAAVTGNKGLGWGKTIGLGIVGSAAGSLLLTLVGMRNFGTIGNIVTGVVGALAVLFLAGVVKKVRARH